MHNIYFDNSATTPVLEAAANRAYEVMISLYGNPSSVHALGVKANEILSLSRKTVMTSLGVKNMRDYELFFTSSGTEADNMAISGVLNAKSFRFKPRIIITDSEHPAVTSTAYQAERNGCEVIRLTTKNGIIDIEQLKGALSGNTVLISVMTVNNETGAVYDVKNIFSIAKEYCPDIITHTDAIQAYMKLPLDIKKLGADMISISGHKIGAPKGIGALLCDSSLITKKRIVPIIHGGGQEGTYRSGTENMPAVAALSEAVSFRMGLRDAFYEKVKALRERIISSLPEGVCVNTPKGEFLPHIISMTCTGIKSEVLLRAMSEKGIYISSGSACSSKKLKTSTVLTAFGLSPNEADSTVRISLSDSNTEEECDIFCYELADCLKRLAKKH